MDKPARPSDHPVLALGRGQIHAGAPACATGTRRLRFSVSATTRAPAPGRSRTGSDYHFISEDAVQDDGRGRRDAGTCPCLRQFLRLAARRRCKTAIEAGQRRAVRHRLAGRAADPQLALAQHTSVDLHPAAVDHRTAPPAGGARAGRRRDDREAHAEKLGRDQPLGRLRLSCWSTTIWTRPKRS